MSTFLALGQHLEIQRTSLKISIYQYDFLFLIYLYAFLDVSIYQHTSRLLHLLACHCGIWGIRKNLVTFPGIRKAKGFMGAKVAPQTIQSYNAIKNLAFQIPGSQKTRIT